MGAANALTFISPMGEPFRSRPGEKPPEQTWFEQADKNGDGKITRAEFLADAGRFFQQLDVNRDGEIGPEEIDRYEEEIAPEVRTGGSDFAPPGGGGGNHRGGRGGGGRRHGGGGGGQHDMSDGEGASSDGPSSSEAYDSSREGASRYSYLDLPEPVAAADTDFNRGVSPREFAAAANERFDALDANHDGVLTRDELPKLSGAREPHGHGRFGGRRESR
jgi:Ca2+-binding EF-hand superfamily protein